MIQHIIDMPWIAIALLLVLIFLHGGIAIRIRREDKLKDRACIDRREMPRPEADRLKDPG
ncbi:MAG: hypothetical protein IPJ48_13500 [Propionivibrio sp.]|uniref:Uncharacterized protein n=1 Tax=Candidatus Propionivibrio dominans TaxID=2954373 RepID=A0A9D7FLI0_9RHOO|nr:hypothetical protein [Candidatus Propionivibrio dominans]